MSVYINCFKVGDAILQALLVTSGYVSYCCLSMVSNQSAQFSLTPDINTFFCTQLPLAGYFLLLGTVLCKKTKEKAKNKTQRCLCQYDNPTRSRGTLTHAQTSGPSGINNRATFQVTLISFLPQIGCWLWTTASLLCHVHMPQCSGLLPCDWLTG